jgi:hypothetical protein
MAERMLVAVSLTVQVRRPGEVADVAQALARIQSGYALEGYVTELSVDRLDDADEDEDVTAGEQ